MDTTVRMLAMLQFIPTFPRKIDVKTLKNRLIDLDPDFKVTERTVERDLNKLEKTFHLVGDGNRPQGWSRLKPDQLSSFNMDYDVIKAFLNAEKLIGNRVDAPEYQALKPFFRNARMQMHAADAGVCMRSKASDADTSSGSSADEADRLFHYAA